MHAITVHRIFISYFGVISISSTAMSIPNEIKTLQQHSRFFQSHNLYPFKLFYLQQMFVISDNKN